MKVSKALREIRGNGKLPDDTDPWLAYWAGWLTSAAMPRTGDPIESKVKKAWDDAIAVAEFIERQEQ